MKIVYPTPNKVFSKVYSEYSPQLSVHNPDNVTLTCKYYIDNETTPRDTKVVSNTVNWQNVVFNSFNPRLFSGGNHTIKFEVATFKASSQFSVIQAPVVTYEYSPEGRLCKVFKDGVLNLQFEYDANGNLIKKYKP